MVHIICIELKTKLLRIRLFQTETNLLVWNRTFWNQTFSNRTLSNQNYFSNRTKHFFNRTLFELNIFEPYLSEFNLFELNLFKHTFLNHFESKLFEPTFWTEFFFNKSYLAVQYTCSYTFVATKVLYTRRYRYICVPHTHIGTWEQLQTSMKKCLRKTTLVYS